MIIGRACPPVKAYFRNRPASSWRRGTCAGAKRTWRSAAISSEPGRPAIAGIGRQVDLAAGGTEIHAARIERIDGHRVALHMNVAVLLRQPLRERLPQL